MKDRGDRVNKPYHEAAALAAKLWTNQTNSSVSVVLTIIHLGEEPPEEMMDYVEKIENDNVKVIYEKAGYMACSLKAQLIRMYLFEKDFVREGDLIMISDADAFVIGEKAVKILDQSHSVWISA